MDSAISTLERVRGLLGHERVPSGGAYVLDEKAFEDRLAEMARLAAELPVEFLFPVKTCPVARVLESAARHGFGFDVSNQGELDLLAELEQNLVVLNGPLAQNANPPPSTPFTFMIGSLEQAATTAQWSAGGVGLRVNSSDLLVGSGASGRSRFGVAVSDIPRVLDEVVGSGSAVTHLHAHHGSNQMTGDDYDRLLAGLLELDRRLGIQAIRFNVGGGQYHSCREIDQLRALVERLASTLPQGVTLVMEPGGANFAGSLYLAAAVLSATEHEEWVEVTVDLCFAATTRWSDCEVVFPYQARARNGAATIRLSGASCDEADSLGVFELPPSSAGARRVMAGDAVVFAEVSPYSLARSFGFNGIPKPGLLFTREGEPRP